MLTYHASLNLSLFLWDRNKKVIPPCIKLSYLPYTLKLPVTAGGITIVPLAVAGSFYRSTKEGKRSQK
jgi:hypothetical protein